MNSTYNKFKRIWEKHSEELSALVTKSFPNFVTSVSQKKAALTEIPVFVFHEVDPITFESQLKYLSENNYRSLGSDELATLAVDNKTEGNEVALSFDDATSTFWTYAYPLLEKYGHKAIVFAIPGLTPEDNTNYPNLKDQWNNKISEEDLLNRKSKQPLCTWDEIEEMSSSDFIDIQCHSLTHARINTSSRLVDFIHPNFDTYFYENISIPISAHDNPSRPLRKVELAAPIFESYTRMMCKNRFYENPHLLKYMQDFIEHSGDLDFFSNKRWRMALKNHFDKWDKNKLGTFENKKDMITAVTHELRESKKLLEERLNKSVTHFCYPWYESCLQADQLAKQEGYDNLYYSMKIPYIKKTLQTNDFSRHTRISEQYLFRLPGEGRKSFSSIWIGKAKNYVAT